MRPYRDNTSRSSRISGKYSGVTFVTRPSGVTIYNDEIDMTNGYVVPFATANGMKMTAGFLNCSGGSISHQSLGLSAIYYVNAHTVHKPVNNVTGACVVVSPEGTKSFGASCTQASFTPFKLNRAGVTYTAAVSISYIAMGT